MCMNKHTVLFEYTNHRGFTETRTVDPLSLYYGSTQWHPEMQWLLEAWDHDRQGDRTFALANVRNWRPAATSKSEPSSAGSSQTSLPPTHC